jgi:hypothetical protein
VTAFVPNAKLKQSVSDVHSHGFRVDPKTGFRFQLRYVTRINEVVRLTVELGNPLNHQSPFSLEGDDCEFLADPPTPASLRSGYHSLCVSPSSEYIVFNSAQVKCTTLIRFAGGKNLSDFDINNLCDICLKRPATVWCVNDSAKLCQGCDEESHRNAIIFEAHTKIQLPKDRALIEFCPMHSDVLVEYYCPRCRVPVCVSCRMSGNHAHENAISHELIPIQAAYDRALRSTQNGFHGLERRRAAITKQLSTVDADLTDVVANSDQIVKEIRRIADAAIATVTRLAGEKALLLRSARTELVRKEAELDAFVQLVSLTRRKAGPAGFLRASERQSTAVRALEQCTDFPRVPRTQFLELKGALEVVELADSRTPQAVRTRSLQQRPLKMDEIEPQDDVQESSRSGGEGPRFPDLQSSLIGSSLRRGESSIISPSLLAQHKQQRYQSRGLVVNPAPFAGSSFSLHLRRLFFIFVPRSDLSHRLICFSHPRGMGGRLKSVTKSWITSG